jgi:hypothetical protein
MGNIAQRARDVKLKAKSKRQKAKGKKPASVGL